MPSTEKLQAHQLRELAVQASCDPRTLQKALQGKPVQPMTLERILRVLRERGIRSAKLTVESPEAT